MSKRKEDSLQTRQDLMDAAFKNFFKQGFENASLEKISKDANVSRGAAYWHFKNKTELFEETVLAVLQKIIDRKQPIFESELAFPEKVLQIMAVTRKDSQNYKFLQQASKTIEDHPEFKELSEKIKETKLFLFHFFESGILNLQKQEKNSTQATALASLFYNYFEGMHSFDIPKTIEKTYDEAIIRENLDLIFKNIF